MLLLLKGCCYWKGVIEGCCDRKVLLLLEYYYLKDVVIWGGAIVWSVLLLLEGCY